MSVFCQIYADPGTMYLLLLRAADSGWVWSGFEKILVLTKILLSCCCCRSAAKMPTLLIHKGSTRRAINIQQNSTLSSKNELKMQHSKLSNPGSNQPLNSVRYARAAGTPRRSDTNMKGAMQRNGSARRRASTQEREERRHDTICGWSSSTICVCTESELLILYV